MSVPLGCVGVTRPCSENPERTQGLDMNKPNPQGIPASNSTTGILANCKLSRLERHVADTIRETLAFADSVNHDNGDKTDTEMLFVCLIHDLLSVVE